jgi:hypothetical protein
MAQQSSKAEMESRVNLIYQRLLLRQNRGQILQFAAKAWGEIGDRTVDSYIKKARDLLLKDLSEDRKAVLAEHIATRNQLFQKAYAASKFQTCIQILDSTAKLQGLFDKQVRTIEESIDDSWDCVEIDTSID